LILDDEIEFPIIGISSALSDYRLVWELNTYLGLSFQKGDDCFNIPNKNKQLMSHEYYLHEDEDDFSKFFLVKNKQKASTLFAQNEKLDFFLILRENYAYTVEDLTLELRKINGVIAVFSFSSSNFEFSEYLNN
jgi:hypothetical protein